MGFLSMGEILTVQAMLKGDALCSSKIFAYYGGNDKESGQPLIKGRTYWHPINHLNRIRLKIHILYEVTKDIKMVKETLLISQIRLICRELFYALNESLKTFIEGLIVIYHIKKLSKSPKFWITLLTIIVYHFTKTESRKKFFNFLKNYFTTT